MDSTEPGLPPAPESRKRYSDIFRSLDNLEISLGNVTLGGTDSVEGGILTP